MVFELREEEKLHFSPQYIFADIDFNTKDKLLDAFKDRVYGFYLDPAKLLDKKEFGFGCGLLCAATIDFLARMTFPKDNSRERIEKWLKENISEFKGDLATRFYEDFRCGLVHEGRIKNPGEFSYQFEGIVTRRNGIVIVNPRMLLERIIEVFENYLASLRDDLDVFNCFRNQLMKDFEDEARRERNLEN